MSQAQIDVHGGGEPICLALRLRFALAGLLALLAPFVACNPAEEGPESAGPERVGSAASAVSCAWDPGFGVSYCYQGDWWVEFSTDDATTSALTVEVSGSPGSRLVDLGGRFVFWDGTVKFTGGSGSAPIPAGTLVRLLATRADGAQQASTGWFAYREAAPLVECGPCSPHCAPDSCGGDGCGGTCACASPAVCMVDATCCQPNASACGPDGCGGTHGPCPCAPSCAGKQCGDDGCGGSCGACDPGATCSGSTCVGSCVPVWSPSWKQTPYAGSWWTEFEVAGGSVPRSVSLQPVGGASVPLSFAYYRWAAGLGGLPAGSSVILRATDATGATAQTLPFRYLVDTVPVTDPCAGTPSSSPTCQPLARGMVTFSMDDSIASQSDLAAPLLAAHGFKATIYHVTDVLSTYGNLPVAQALAQAGHEVASHSRTHPYLPALGPQALDDELRLSQGYLVAHVGSPVESFASPMGGYDDAVIAASRLYFTSHRTVDPGLNYMGSDVYRLKADGVYGSTTVSAACASLAEAASYRGWRILVFHAFTSAATSDASLTYPLADLEGILACAESTPGLDVVTTRQGVALLACASP